MKAVQQIFAVMVLATAPLSAHARIVEIKSYAQVTVENPADTLVVFDLDNTLIEPVQTLGSDQWGTALQRLLKAQGLSQHDADELGGAEFARVQLQTKVKTVEPLTPAFVAELQGRGFKTLGLTARPIVLVDRSHEELASVGIDLEQSAFTQKELTLSTQDEARLKRGVLYVGPHNNKGKLLRQLFQELGQSVPKRIVFFDDKSHHVATLESELAGVSDYVGYRYGAADAKVAAYDPQLGAFAYRIFNTTGTILLDNEVRKLMNQESAALNPNQLSFVSAWLHFVSPAIPHTRR